MPRRPNRDFTKALCSRGSIQWDDAGCSRRVAHHEIATFFDSARATLRMTGAAPRDDAYPMASVFRGVDQAILLDPRHHVAELGADLLDLMLLAERAHRFERRRAGTVLEDELASELTLLDLAQDFLHLGLRLVGDDTRAAGEVA